MDNGPLNSDPANTVNQVCAGAGYAACMVGESRPTWTRDGGSQLVPSGGRGIGLADEDWIQADEW